jgi:Family of unknown function (DUF6152)
VKNKAFRVYLVAAFFMTSAVALSAHHGSAGYDMEKELTMKATVTQWLWANPHCFLKFDATDEKGEVIHWAAEVSNPIDMTKRGWSKSSLKTGDEVTVTIRPAKNGAPVAQLLKIVLPSGQTLIGWSPSVR